jgi:hypothetical protein
MNDPHQINNLIDDAGHESLIRKMEKKLRAALKRIGDEDFKPHPFYFQKFGFQINGLKKDQVPYSTVPGQQQPVISPRSHY